MVILFHGTLNASTAAGSEPNIYTIVGIVGTVAAVLVAIFARPANLSRVGKHTLEI